MKRNIPSGVAFLVILSAAFVVGSMAAYVVSTSTRIDTDPVQLNIPKRMAQDEPVLLIPSDWVEQRSEEYGFKVSVPPDHAFTSQQSQFGIDTTSFFVWPDGAREFRWTIDIWDVGTWDQGGTAAEFIEDRIETERDQRGFTGRDMREEISVSGSSAVLVTVTIDVLNDDVLGNWVLRTIYIERRGSVIEISNGARDEKEFDTFLSSFEFIDETSGIAI